ncbi:hypothetical protein ND861_17215 [Leptospira sp. 2 VSF19]|uniref:Tetratricopeptide repeat protein n=1 Tax=Leptospira soteropolitanensis TaxID=2950025 RepID=A0AAW5VGH0_9LEPT|nr:hypothetical protein [Leptospira soteropolitanensis]MCW7494389.1 hypothetical protein [Leptospira soteropolitanensis]MCW7501902.1 hypothetical protein [Leptospira soteropolitanensis]MCW7524235.1 hypothetical protein [Leptospira soteropolitanensis]MCW7528100.1 hypothetical protein [Leptospira soteropolitanensis]MCW7531954.1 hypothetical protein [Leptospira soteropolitanensis]
MNRLSLSIFLLCIFAFPMGNLMSQTQRNHGWVVSGNSSKLLIQGKEILNARDDFRFKAPEGMNQIQEIDYYLMLGEYYLRKKDKVGIANILYDLRTKKGEYAFADSLLTSLWKQSQSEEVQAIKILDTYIQKEPNTYFRNLAKNMRTNLFQTGEDEKKSMVRMDCQKNKPYYSLCRVFRLQYYIDLPSGKEKEMHKHFVNIMRVSSPFFEDPNLEWIPLLDRIDEDLPAKLSFLGFAREGIHLQKMMMDLEKITDGFISENSNERMAFFQILSGDYAGAEESLLNFLKLAKGKKTSILNRVYVKLGALAYLQKDYKKSLDYYLKLDLTNWSADIHHPYLNEPMSISGVKDLISVSLYKVNGADAALKALQKIKDPEKLTEADIWPKLRISQMLMDQNPELSSRMTDEIIYMAQEKKWRRLEYAATVLQGYNQIYRKEFRKSTIELTKSRGILDEENAFYAAEFLRNFGFVFAHTASGKKGPVNGNIRDGVSDYLQNNLYEDLYYIRNYRPLAFSTDLFFEYALSHLRDDNDVWGLLDSVYKYNAVKWTRSLKGSPHSLFQIQFVDKQFQYLSGFSTTRESKFFDSTYADSRETESQIQRKSEEESVRNLESAKHPTVILLPYKEEFYLFTFNPRESRRNQLTWKVIRSQRPDTSEAIDSVRELVSSNKDTETVQIYLNESGASLMRSLKKEMKETGFTFFFSLQPGSDPQKPLNTFSWKCPQNMRSLGGKGMNLVDTAYFEGSRILKEKERLHLWDFSANASPLNSVTNLSWSCKSDLGSFEEIPFLKLFRRIDYRTVPRMVVYTERVVGKSFADYSWHYQWLHFWFRSGTKKIGYLPTLPVLDAASVSGLADPSRYQDEGVWIHATPQ